MALLELEWIGPEEILPPPGNTVDIHIIPPLGGSTPDIPKVECLDDCEKKAEAAKETEESDDPTKRLAKLTRVT